MLVHSCDRYELLYKGFEYFFEKTWDSDVACKYYFATEEKLVSIKNFTNIQSGKGQWADRLKKLLTEKISEKYVLYMQEDMWLTGKVNPGFFNQLFELAEKNDWKQVKLHSSEVYKTIPTDLFIENFNVSQIDNENSGFLMSHQNTLWNKDFLVAQMHENEHPWRNERKGSKRLKALNLKIFHIDYFGENGKPAINANKEPVKRCDYFTVSVNGTLNSAAEPFIKELLAGDQETKTYGAKLQHNYEHQLTHDGLPKPRKVDMFKRIKNWIRGKK